MKTRRGALAALVLLATACGGAVDTGDASNDVDGGSRAMDGSAPEPTDGGQPDLPDTGPLTCAEPERWYRDHDGDGHGDPSASVESCEDVEGFVQHADDCDDNCSACHSGAVEVCDGRDNDCDGSVDQTFACVPGAMVACTTACGTSGMGSCTTACAIPSGAACVAPAESCNGADDDCDGAVDDTFTCAAGSPSVCITTCGTTGTGTCTSTCEPAAASACAPPAETCNGMDDDCDGVPDQTFACALGASVSCTTACGTEGTGSCTSGCAIPSGAACTPPAETCNGVDDDCDGTLDDGFTCAQGTTTSCTTSCGSVGSGTCTSACAAPPSSSCAPPAETCTYTDDDCDGLIDEGAMNVGGPWRIPTGANFGRPRAAKTRTQIHSIWYLGGRNWWVRMNLDGTSAGARYALDHASVYDIGANANAAVYASVDTAGDLHIHRLADSPSYGAEYRWSRTIASNAVEVHVAVGAEVWVYTRSADGRVQYHSLDFATGVTLGNPTLVAFSPRRVSVWSNGYRLHLVAASIGDSIRWYLNDMTMGRIASGSFSAPSARLNDFVVTGDSRTPSGGPIDYRGFLVVYALAAGSGQPDEIRYYSRLESGASFNDRILADGIADPSDFSQMTLDMADGIAQLAFVRGHISAAAGTPLIYQLTKRSSGAGYSRRTILSRLSNGEYEGIAIIRLPDSAGALPDRLVYDPGGNDIASVPIGCF